MQIIIQVSNRKMWYTILYKNITFFWISAHVPIQVGARIGIQRLKLWKLSLRMNTMYCNFNFSITHSVCVWFRVHPQDSRWHPSITHPSSLYNLHAPGVLIRETALHVCYIHGVKAHQYNIITNMRMYIFILDSLWRCVFYPWHMRLSNQNNILTSNILTLQ